MILASLAALGAIVVAFVLVPIFSEDKRTAIGVSDAEHALLDLEEKKSRLYEAINDLDFEKAAGKVSETDYTHARDDYLSQVAEVMAELDALAPEKSVSKKRSAKSPVPEDSETTREAAARRACASCGATSPLEARFCVQCGLPLAAGCASCGHELPEEARFCPGCGEKTA